MFAFTKRRCAYDDYDDSSEEGSSEDGSDSPVEKITISSGDEDQDFTKTDAETPLRLKLLQVLTGIRKMGSAEFAVGKVCPDLTTTPGIKIAGYGNISLPITDKNVENIKQHFQQAPYGLGEDTLIDKAVRDSWQLNPENFEITNPQFNAGVDKVVQEVKQALGCAELNITSHLYKLLLYETGGHFKPHRDTEKHPGMFATLIIQVPSVFTGGDLLVTHNSQEKRVKFGADEAAFQCIYAAHYADCEHELTEITSGYRMALVYSLCWDGNGVVPRPPDKPTNRLADLLKQMNEGSGMVAWALDHQYSKNSLVDKGAEALKGSDKLIYSSLQGANELLDEEKKFEFFIVKAKRVDNMSGECSASYNRWGCCNGGDCFDPCGDTYTDYKYKVIGVDGDEWDSSLNFDIDVRKDVLNVGKSKTKFWGECHEGECSGPSGNEGAEKSNWYCRYVLVMFLKENAIQIVYKNSVGSAINYLRKELDEKGASSVKKLTTDVFDLCIAKKSDLCKRQEDVVALIKILTEMKEVELLKKVLQMLTDPFLNHYPTYMYSSSVLYRSSYSYSNKPVKVGFGFPSASMSDIIMELLTSLEGSFAEEVTNLVKTCSPTHFKNVITFLQRCPEGKLPTEDLLTSVVQKALNLQEKLSDDILICIGQAIKKLPASCIQFIQPFLDFPNLQSLKMINNVLAFWTEKTSQELNTDQFYQLTFAKFWQMMQQSVQGSSSNMPHLDINAIVVGAEFLVNKQETSKFNSLVDDVLKSSNPQLMKKLLCSSMCQSVNANTPVQYLIQARINQLKPLVQVGKPMFSWSMPTAVVPNYPDIQAFLRGPERDYVYRRFHFRTHADKFRRECSCYLRNVDVRIDGVRSDTTVYLKKSSSLQNEHEAKVKKYHEDCDELRQLEAKLVAN